MKRLKYHNDDDDDEDFEVVPYRARTKNAENTTSDSELDEVGELRRISPRWLVDALHNLNPRQCSAVEDMGFRHLFLLQVDSVPGKLVTWFLGNFQPSSCTLQLPNNQTIHIAAEDVFLIFGFPNGASQIAKKGNTKDKEIVDEWAAKFEKDKFKILPSDIVAAMMAEVEAGPWFRRYFLMLVESCLFENASDGYVKPKIMDILRNLARIREYDWCDHMITSLQRSHERWVANNTNKFTGPSVFIVVFVIVAVFCSSEHKILCF